MRISLSSEWIKTKRTPYRYLLGTMPIIFNCLIFIYLFISNSKQDTFKVIQNYFSILNFLLPFACILLGSLLYQIDKDAGFFKNIIHSKKDTVLILSTKFIFYYLQITLIYFISVFFSLIIIYLNTTLLTQVVAFEFIKDFIFIWMYSTTMIVIANIICALCSFIGAIILGSVISLMTAIIGLTGLGDGIWIFFPFTWGFRFLFLHLNYPLLFLLAVAIPLMLYSIYLGIICYTKFNK